MVLLGSFILLTSVFARSVRACCKRWSRIIAASADEIIGTGAFGELVAVSMLTDRRQYSEASTLAPMAARRWLCQPLDFVGHLVSWMEI
jgi:hypothetical protein